MQHCLDMRYTSSSIVLILSDMNLNVFRGKFQSSQRSIQFKVSKKHILMKCTYCSRTPSRTFEVVTLAIFIPLHIPAGSGGID